jgi:predicted transcriptional regulator
MTTMAKRDLPRPTDAELAILRVLWQRGPSTVRDVTDALQSERGTGYTTALKLMQIMTDKGLVERDDSQRTHVYRAVAAAEETQRQLVGDLLERAFGGSAQQLVLQALSSKKASRAELAEIRKLLDEMEKKAK